MLINGINISTYGAVHQSHDIQTAEVITYKDWLRNSSDFMVTGQKETYKQINCDMLVRGTNEDDILLKIGNLVGQIKNCTIQFDNSDYIYKAVIKVKDHKKLGNDVNNFLVYSLHIEFESGYSYKSAVNETINNIRSKDITVLGNLPTPPIVTITPSIDTVAVALTGMTKKPIIIKNLHANTPVIINGEKCTVTEIDIDDTLTIATGANKWNFRKYNMAGFANPDDTDVFLAPTYATIPPSASYYQQLVPDSSNLAKNLGYDYLGYLKTAVNVVTAKTIVISLCHDDGCTVYLNGVAAYSHNYHANVDNGKASITLNLKAGWNTIEILWIQHYGPDGIYDIVPTFSSQVGSLNCFYSKNEGLGTVNKFEDTDMWAFPELIPGINTIGIDSNVCTVDIVYKPKFR